jgi:hypothetical protein
MKFILKEKENDDMSTCLANSSWAFLSCSISACNTCIRSSRY